MREICFSVFVYLELMKSVFILFVYNFSKLFLFWVFSYIILVYLFVVEFNEIYILL